MDSTVYAMLEVLSGWQWKDIGGRLLAYLIDKRAREALHEAELEVTLQNFIEHTSRTWIRHGKTWEGRRLHCRDKLACCMSSG